MSWRPRLVALDIDGTLLGSVTCSLGVPTRHLDLQFIAVAPAGAEAVISEESLDLRWFGVDALPDGVDAGLRQLVTAARYRWSSGSRSPE